MKTPQIVFANSMSDVCHPNVKASWIDRIVRVVHNADWHFYMFLTKRPGLIAQKFYAQKNECSPRFSCLNNLPEHMAMGTSIDYEKFLWRGYSL